MQEKNRDQIRGSLRHWHWDLDKSMYRFGLACKTAHGSFSVGDIISLAHRKFGLGVANTFVLREVWQGMDENDNGGHFFTVSFPGEERTYTIYEGVWRHSENALHVAIAKIKEARYKDGR